MKSKNIYQLSGYLDLFLLKLAYVGSGKRYGGFRELIKMAELDRSNVV